jgi:DNA relaxase NicK
VGSFLLEIGPGPWRVLQQSLINHDKVVSLGVDWLTASQRSDYRYEPFEDLAVPMLLAEKDAGNFLKPWSSCGYEGFHCGQVDVGTREDGSLIRLSGQRAAEDWSKVLKHATGCSRLDLQVTIRMSQGASHEINWCYRKARRHVPETGKAPIVTLIRSTKGGRTVNLGSRTSEAYGRIYDKWAESGLDHFRNCVRFEVEFKKHASQVMGNLLLLAPARETYIASGLCEFFGSRGVPLASYEGLSELHFVGFSSRPSPPVTDAAASLRWLRTSVKPSVRRLVESGRLAEVLSALGLADDVLPVNDES